METAERGALAAPGELARLSAIDLLDGYRRGRFTPRDVIDEVIASLRRIDSACAIMVADNFAAAMAEADRASAAWRSGEPPGPLAGIPVSVKDLIYVANLPARAGSPVFRDFVPDRDAGVVERLRQAGAIITCKTTTCESGYKLTADSPVSGITRNPWSTDRTSGGSSGGAAAGVAAGGGPLAVGTDGVGSIRVPSSFCGVVGLKPTFGLVSRAPGFFPPSWASLAHTGPIARTVADAALLLQVLAGYDNRDAASLPVGPRDFQQSAAAAPMDGLRIGFSLDFGYAAVHPEVRAAVLRAIDALSDLGADTVPLDLSLSPSILEDVLKPVAYTEQAAAANRREPATFAQSDADYRSVIEAGRAYSGVDYIEASYRRGALRTAFLGAFEKVDAIVTPSVAVPAFAAGTLGVDRIDGRPVDRHLGWSPFSWPINLVGLPAASVPCGFDSDGLPVGLQVVAPWLREDIIFRIAGAYEARCPWQDRWPALV